MPDPDKSEALKRRELNIIDAFYYLECAGISKEALEVVEAVVEGRYCYHGDTPGFRQYGVVVPQEDKPCPPCGGSGEVPAYALNIPTGERHQTGMMKCWFCFGTGKEA